MSSKLDFLLDEDITEAILSSNAPEKVLWHPNAVATLLTVIRRANNPVSIEAAAGALQNLTAGQWRPAEIVRAEVCSLLPAGVNFRV